MASKKFLHDHPNFIDLLRITAQDLEIVPGLIEKDYWVMHCLYGLQQMKLRFELKGGTSLSKGYGYIHRFSEDLDIRIEPPADMKVPTGKNQDSAAHRDQRKSFYDWLTKTIRIDGIDDIQRDPDFDDAKFRSGGVRLFYKKNFASVSGLKDGILLEVGFDDVTPNEPRTISSWAYDFAIAKTADLEDNRALGVSCYHPGYTLVEKLQTISTKFRKYQESPDDSPPKNFMRQYYDVYCLLQIPEVRNFVETPEYKTHKAKRFPKADNQNISENDAFLLKEDIVRKNFKKMYEETASLYYKGQPDFYEMLKSIQEHIDKL